MDEAERRFDECVAFGEALIRTRDLDPVYCAVVDAGLKRAHAERLLFSYWCYYSLGASAWLSDHEGASYWAQSRVAAENVLPSPLGGRWPRGAERRHFRGQKCVDAIDWFSARGTPEQHVEDLLLNPTVEEVISFSKGWPMFGDWVSFKILDMCERCLLERWLQVPASIPLMYEAPQKALDLLPEGSYWRLLTHFGLFDAPPDMWRKCGPAEVETVLCKFASSLGGHYHVGKDIHEVREALHGWGPTADRLLAAMPPEVACERVAA
jgi:hypothetical protein